MLTVPGRNATTVPKVEFGLTQRCKGIRTFMSNRRRSILVCPLIGYIHLKEIMFLNNQFVS